MVGDDIPENPVSPTRMAYRRVTLNVVSQESGLNLGKLPINSRYRTSQSDILNHLISDFELFFVNFYICRLD